MTNNRQAEILEEIDLLEGEMRGCVKEIDFLKKKMSDWESALIEAKIKKEKLAEELRQIRASDPTFVPELRDLEIQRFRDKFPELCSNLKK